MLSENLRQRLELLNRDSLPAARGELAAPVRTSPPRLREVIAPSAIDASSSTLPGEAIATQSAEHWLVRQGVASLWPSLDERLERWRSFQDERIELPPPKRQSKRTKRQAAEVAALAETFPRGTLFLDLETCGLAGAMVFLVGLLRHDGDSLVLEQLLARNYAEEQAILATLWQRAAQASLLVTFNGKTFDWPLVQYRSTYHRIAAGGSASTLAHVDVLHHARRRWRHQLPDCRLQTLERFLCRRRRSGDIPGRDVPEAYRQYVATGRVDQMQAILHHNALDLITLVELSMLLTTDETAHTHQPSERQIPPSIRFVDEAA